MVNLVPVIILLSLDYKIYHQIYYLCLINGQRLLASRSKITSNLPGIKKDFISFHFSGHQALPMSYYSRELFLSSKRQ